MELKQKHEKGLEFREVIIFSVSSYDVKPVNRETSKITLRTPSTVNITEGNILVKKLIDSLKMWEVKSSYQTTPPKQN